MRSFALAALACMAIGVALGLSNVKHVASAPAPAPTGAENDAPLVHAGVRVEDAVALLQDTNEPPPIVEEPMNYVPAVASPQAPPPPDVAQLLRHDVSAIVRLEDGLGAWIVDQNAPGNRRLLTNGSTYRQGWRVRSITHDDVVLTKGREQRVVSLFSTYEWDTKDAAADAMAQSLQEGEEGAVTPSSGQAVARPGKRRLLISRSNDAGDL
jgi:hypothetical protein